MKFVNTILIIAILLFATAITWTYFASQGSETPAGMQVGVGGGPETKDINYQAQFRVLMVEHANLAANHLSNLYDGDNTAESSRKLEENAQKLSEVIGHIGTPTDQSEFLRIFRGHIDEYEAYTKGKRENQPEAQNIAKENLQMHAMDFGNLINKLMPTISEEQATKLMNDHAVITLAIVDEHAEKDVTAKLNEIKEANAQALRFADELAKGAEQTSQ